MSDDPQLDLFANAVPATRPRDLVGYRFAPEPSSTPARRRAGPLIVPFLSDDGSCKLIPFPQIRRRRFVTRNAIRLAGLPHKTAEKLLAATLKRQAEAMTRKGIPAAVVERESRSLERAIRAELRRQVILRPDDTVA
jgi:hypothetical protein